MKKLPIGIPSVEDIINKGYTYVDKTALIFRLIGEGKYYFLSPSLLMAKKSLE